MSQPNKVPVPITDDNADSLIKQLWEDCDVSQGNCRSGTKCGPVTKKDALMNSTMNTSGLDATRFNILKTATKWNNKAWDAAAETDTANLCILKTEEEKSGPDGFCAGIGDCKTSLMCDMDEDSLTYQRCQTNPGAGVSNVDDVKMTTWTSDASIPTCKTDVDCARGTFCQATQDPRVNICASASDTKVQELYGTCFVSEALKSDGKEIVPRIDATKSKCKPGLAMTVDWKDEKMNCKCCTTPADPNKERCGVQTPIMKYDIVLKKGLESAYTMF